MKLKKFLAALISAAILVSTIPVNIFAYDFTSSDALEVLVSGVTEPTMPKLSLVCIESDGDTRAPMPKKNGNNYVTISDVTSLAGGTSFFVGILAENFDKFKYNNEGTYMWGTSVAYNPTYVTWEPTNSRGAVANFQKRIHDANKFEFTEYQTYTVGSYAEKNTESDANVATGCSKSANILVQYSPANPNDDYLYKLPNSEYIAFLEFKVTEGDTNTADGLKIFDFSQSATDTYIQFGSSGDYAYTYNNADSKLHNYLKLDASGADIFPAGAAHRDGIVANLGSGKNLTYKDAENLRTSDFTITGHDDQGGTPALQDSTVKFYRSTTAGTVGAGGVSTTRATDMTGYTEIVNGTAWTNGVVKNDTLGNHLYVVADGYIAYLGQLTVENASITGLSNGALTDGFTNKVVGVDNISFTGGQVTATYDNGGKSKAIQFADFGTNNLAVYRKDGTTYTEIPATGSTVKFAAANAIYIATKDASNKKEVKVKDIAGTAVTTTYSIKTQPKTAYTYPETLDISSLVITVTSTDPSLAGDKTLAQAQAAGIFDTVKIGTETVTAGTTKITKAHANKTIDFYKGTTKVAGLSSSKITFTPKEVTLTAAPAATPITKVYDGNNTVSGTITYSATGLEAGDSAGTISGLTATYASTDVADDIAITIAGTPASNNADFNNKYTFAAAKPTNVKGNITTKALTNLTFTVTASQNISQSGPYTIPDGNFELAEANGKVGSDDVKIKHTGGTISEANMQNGVTDAAVTDMTCELDGAKKGNYSLGTVTVKATVTNLPVIKALPQATLDAIAAATKNGANNWKASDEKTLDQLKAALPTSAANVSDDKGGKHAVTIAWAIDPADTTLNAKGGTYTFKGTVTTADSVLINLDTPLTATIVVDAVTVTAADANVKTSYTVGDTADALPATATITADGQTLTLPITWDPATVDTSADNSATGGTKYTATINYTGKDWLTVPSTFETIEKTIVVSDRPLTVVKSVKDAPADITINAGNEKNQPDNKLAELLPNKLTVIDADNNEVEVDVEWATTDTYDVKGGEYTYTATFKTEGYDYSAVSGDKAPTVKVTVDPVKLGYDSSIFNAKTVNTGAKIDLKTSGTATLTPSVDGVNVPYTVKWTPDPTTADTSAATTLTFTGTVAFDQTVLDANPWLTVPTELSKDVTVTVKKKSSGGGGGGTSAYTVKFSAGKYGKITEGKTSVSIIKGKKVETTSLPTVTPNEGYKFLGWSIDGKTVIDPTADAVSKGVTYTALYEEIVEPTPTPSQTPIIDKNYTKPYASGYDDGMFLPNDYITRAELASMIARLSYGDDIPDSYRASFPDVDDTWYNKYIGYLEDKNVLSGYEDGTFRPNQTVTRGEMCAVIARAQKYDLISVDDMFSDVTDADWAKAYITTLATKNIVSGYEDGTFGTYSPITRAETVAIINRILEPSTAIITFTPLDIAGHWAEADILLAVNEREIKGTVTEPTATPEATPEATAEPEATPEVTPEATTEPTETPAA